MNENDFWGRTRSSGVKMGMIVRIALALFATFGSIALALTLLNPHDEARASGVVEVGTNKNPWGLVQDGTHIWVAEPGCDLSPTCPTQFPGTIGEYTQTNPPTLVANYTEPTGFTSPGFVALDGKGNIWFTEPTSNAIGELTPSTTPTAQPTWQQWGTSAGITANSVPRDLVFDHHGNIWFTEATGNRIGWFNTTTHTAVENALVTAGSDPYGILYNGTTNTVWFAENGNTMLGSFTPNTTGTVKIKEHSVGVAKPHMLAIDASGNVWYSEGQGDAVGEYSITSNNFRDFSVATAICPSGGSCLTGTYVAGVAIDGNGVVWFDDVHTGSVGFITPPAGTFAKTKTPTPSPTLAPSPTKTPKTPTPTPGNTPTPGTTPTPTPAKITISAIISSPFDGLITDASNNVWATEKNGSNKLALIPPGTRPTPTPIGTGTPQATGTPSGTITGPVNKTWYFAEGKVGSGFTEFLTLENPDTANSCAVNIEYLLATGNPINVAVTVPAATRFTESVNTDLNTPASGANYQTDSAIVTVNSTTTPNCTGIVAERPMYFTNFTGVSSGSDVMGATKTSKTYYFADVPTGGGYSSFLTILNPGTTVANVTATFVVGGTTVNTQSIQVAAGTRGTIIPTTNSGSLRHAAVTVTSDQAVVVERPTYFSNVNGGNAGTVSGAASVVGVPTLKNDWLFAEGYTGGKFQEYFVLANFGTTAVSANVVLEFSNGHTETVTENIAPSDQTFVDVNAIVANNTGTCDVSPCQPTQDVSAEISSTGNFIAQREMYFQYNHVGNGRTLNSTGGTDVIGENAAVSSYSFAEGYTNVSYDEWLTLQNPSTTTETINLMVVNEDGHSFSQSYTLVAHSRFTIDITGLVLQHLIVAGDTFKGYEVSLTTQAGSGALFMAERPMYWNTGSGGTQGGSDVIGYDGK